MATESSFDIVSKVNMQEVDNAVNQTLKEISQRYDFKGSHSEIVVDADNMKITAEDDYKLKSVIEILKTKLINRKVPVRNLDYSKIEEASGGSKRQNIKIKQGIESEAAKKIVKDIKGLNLKVQAQIMSDQVRVTGKNKDDLQKVIGFLREKDYGLELQFINYR
ncbi:hypothetical protein EDC14_104717 [Hydrogenispora ethanolica]|jgi:uncharacterized protein YajQ (UPF0234 family)|uniref:Nucleotide-binding protein EDC14_104717 n=1 Tax=Hydrogenispora ethanolica TaxID=1082276 RepID=A0A4R1QXV6_HYDET|nr:YajQ family cyclic di-GMP-binding protein [Hydrogenispora ethanolica]TCL57114.1 hypothetical protein EDC14_104717 [Hydrogenispora ethanolica]